MKIEGGFLPVLAGLIPFITGTVLLALGVGTVRNGLYLMKQGVLYDGRGLILGPNSPFKNIPILGTIL